MGISAGISARCLALLWPLALVACSTGSVNFGSEDNRSISFTDDRGVANQPYPSNHRGEIVAFMRTYLNNPVGVHDAEMAEPMQRTVGGRLRYVSCLRYAAREPDGSYRQPGDRAILFVDGRLDRLVENAGEICAGAAYAPFAELTKLTR